MDILEYSITLSTREEIQVAEFDPEVVPGLRNETTKTAISSVLSMCTYMNRDTIEKAKRGDLKPLERSLRTPPYGCLMKLDYPVCSQINSCVSANKKECTSKFIVKNLGKFPFCWSYESPNNEAKELAITIVNAWKDGKYVIIIRD